MSVLPPFLLSGLAKTLLLPLHSSPHTLRHRLGSYNSSKNHIRNLVQAMPITGFSKTLELCFYKHKQIHCHSQLTEKLMCIKCTLAVSGGGLLWETIRRKLRQETWELPISCVVTFGLFSSHLGSCLLGISLISSNMQTCLGRDWIGMNCRLNGHMPIN